MLFPAVTNFFLVGKVRGYLKPKFEGRTNLSKVGHAKIFMQSLRYEPMNYQFNT